MNITMNGQGANLDLNLLRRELIEHHRRHGFKSPDELLDFIETFFHGKSGNPLCIPRCQVCQEHTPPAQYLVDAFFERTPDAICWANRGGGKTLLGALVTWLDTVFKGGCATKVLGGSLEQSKRMYEHLTGEGDGWGLVNGNFQHLLRGEILAQRTVLNNLSNIQILTASSKSVRGAHPQKLKLDEVDEMDPRIYEAALSIPMTKGGHRGSTHIYSTMHKTYGLMQTVVEDAPARGYRLYKWCILDVLERCEGRDCADCDLWEDCQGRAREADGYYRIDDAITRKRQVSEQTWRAEYLCQIPSSEGLIYKEFDMALHVV
jgi:hypothetical protein